MPDLWVEDMAGLIARAYGVWSDVSGVPVVLNPRFKPGVDGDLIAAGILYELKTGVRLEFPAWIRQLLAYTLLDFANDFGISGIGFYLARHAVLMQWSMDEVFRVAGGSATPTLAELRAGFRACIEKTSGPIDGPRPAMASRHRWKPLGPGSDPWEKDLVSVAEAGELTGRTAAAIRRSVVHGALVSVNVPTGKRPANYAVSRFRGPRLRSLRPRQAQVLSHLRR
jgi:hypothetical protein